ncbi:MAG: hypothetical protein DWQ47_04980 [Acidobacteria bacterium]|nr:MAG: hypothetical protein DWQ32_08530 [Acidobacteriota bacterium]REK01736.1 MAG: hypothetical protein DWQ38_04965 [Acidobacteriota bacterium]REK14692.1 MAG: hypothetical protein DWQ43_14220 [Acidobacteriota bacterium]REK45407.1 MAG: hypothetical protein DWQ47_04980 [Acidobacteriota bacterium]
MRTTTTLLILTTALLLTFPSGCGMIDEPFADLSVARTLSDEGFLSEPFGIAEKDGMLYFSDGAKGSITVTSITDEGCWNPLGCSSRRVITEKMKTPSHIAIEDGGDILVADSGDHTILRVSPEGEITLVAGVSGNPGFRDGKADQALFRAPIGIAVQDGRIFVADTYNDRIRVIENGMVRTLAGSGRGFADGDSASARFDTPCGIELLVDGRLLIADLGNRKLRTIGPDGTTSTFAGDGRRTVRDGGLTYSSFSAPTDVAVGQNGEIYVADGDSVRVIGRRFVTIVETLTSTRRGFEDKEDGRSRFNRVSGIAVAKGGDVYAADSDNGLIRSLGGRTGQVKEAADLLKTREWDGDINHFHPSPNWPYDPPLEVREIAGTFGEIRGKRDRSDSDIYLHNGIDIPGSYGETARFVSNETVLDPEAVQNVGTLRELIRMPHYGYVHINIGRAADGTRFSDPRFLFDENSGELTVRVPRGTLFEGGDPVGTLNRMNHVHFVKGRSGFEFNGLGPASFPYYSDKIAPVIEKIDLVREDWTPFETEADDERIKVGGRVRVIAETYDRMDGNPERRRLGLYILGYRVFDSNGKQVGGANNDYLTIRFEKLPSADLASYIYAVGSRSGATGPTVFRYIVTNRLNAGKVTEGFINFDKLEPGDYDIEVVAEDWSGNRAVSRVSVSSL